MIENILLYAAVGFGAAILITLIVKLVFIKNVNTVNMSKHLQSNFKTGKSLQTQVRELVESGNKNEAVDLLKNSGKLSSDQSEKVIDMLGKLSNKNDVWSSSGNELISEVKKLISENKKIEAIKLIKKSGVGSLKEAKDIVDKIDSGSPGM